MYHFREPNERRYLEFDREQTQTFHFIASKEPGNFE